MARRIETFIIIRAWVELGSTVPLRVNIRIRTPGDAATVTTITSLAAATALLRQRLDDLLAAAAALPPP